MASHQKSQTAKKPKVSNSHQFPAFDCPKGHLHHHHLHLQAHRNLLRQANRKPSYSCPKAWTWTTLSISECGP
jgi:hypothetical protein